jgi:hypothetical protein
MTILEFFEQSVGKWFCQRTSYHLGQTEHWHRSDKTNIFQEVLPADAGDVVALCDRCHISPTLALGGLRSSWEKSYTQPAGSVLLVPLAEEDHHNENRSAHGTLLRFMAGAPPTIAQYEVTAEKHLILITEDKTHFVKEQIWFAGSNLRLRTSLISLPGHLFEFSSFYSEIRMGGLS